MNPHPGLRAAGESAYDSEVRNSETRLGRGGPRIPANREDRCVLQHRSSDNSPPFASVVLPQGRCAWLTASRRGLRKQPRGHES